MSRPRGPKPRGGRVGRRAALRTLLGTAAAGAVAPTLLVRKALAQVETPVPRIEWKCYYKFTNVQAPPTCEECYVQNGYFFCMEQECEFAADCQDNIDVLVNCRVGTGYCTATLRLLGCGCPAVSTPGGGGDGGGIFGRAEGARVVGELIVRTRDGRTAKGMVVEMLGG